MFFFPKTKKWLSLKVLKQQMWSIIWNSSEYFHIPLGKYAPYVFHKMIGAKKMEKSEKNNQREHRNQ